MKNQKSNHRQSLKLSRLLLPITVVGIGLLFTLLPSIAQALLNTPTPFPTDFPPIMQTREVSFQQYLDSLPTPATPIFILPLPAETSIPSTPIGTPAGAGLITRDFLAPKHGVINGWYEQLPDSGLLVYTGGGASIFNPADVHGFIGVVHLYPGVDFSDLTWFPAPAGVGALTIVGAESERLILRDNQNNTYYFDVPGRTFVSSLTEVVPTVTTIPTPTPASRTPIYDDDAPDDPWLMDHTSPSNTDLSYVINPSNDIDWFRFHNDIPGTIQVDLTNLAANYDLYVYSATDSQLRGSSTNPGQDAEQVIVENAPVDDYYVGIGGADDAAFSTTPYTLRFNTLLPPTATLTLTTTPTPTPTATSMPITLSFYLHGSGATANPPTLFLDSTAPAGTTAKYKDSASVNFSGGNPWKEIGAWTAAPELTAGQLTSLSDLRVWLGLKNSDDIGTRFDLRAEVYRNGELVTSGETYCITGVTRNANQAQEVAIAFAAFAPVNFDGVADGLTLKILVRIGTDGAGAFCGGHSNAVGVRLYFDAVSRAAKFESP